MIKIKKGLDIHIPGVAERSVRDMRDIEEYAVLPGDYVGMTPRLLVAEGDAVCAGTPLCEDKKNADCKLLSPVSGTVKAVVRGDKRALEAIVVMSDKEHKSLSFNTVNPLECDRDDAVVHMSEAGLWHTVLQRPFGIVPHAADIPKSVFVSTFDSSPLPVDFDYALRGREEDFQWGVNVLHVLGGKVHLSLDADSQTDSFFAQVKNADIHWFSGCHPAGLVGTQISKVDPINKGERVWTVDAQDVAIIGHLFRCGEYRPERVVAMTGSVVETPCYYRIISGACVKGITSAVQRDDVRFVDGNVLSGKTLSRDGFLSASAEKISVLPEGDKYDFLGWLRPNIHKYSFSRTFVSGFLSRRRKNGYLEKCTVDTGMHGGVRPLFVTGEFEKLVPIDIYPMQLIKACMTGDIDQMENLGIYEVEPEDLALCEFADTSKTEIQAAVRSALELLRANV